MKFALFILSAAAALAVRAVPVTNDFGRITLYEDLDAAVKSPKSLAAMVGNANTNADGTVCECVSSNLAALVHRHALEAIPDDAVLYENDKLIMAKSRNTVPAGAVGAYTTAEVDKMVSEAKPEGYDDVRSKASSAYAHAQLTGSNPHGVTPGMIGAVSNTVTINGHQLNKSTITLTAANVSAVPNTARVNGKLLTGSPYLYASDVGAATPDDVNTAKRELFEGGVYVTRTLTPTEYRSGRSGDLGYGYAYAVQSADGYKRFGVDVPAFDFGIQLSSDMSDDPIVAYYGSWFDKSVLATEYTWVSTPEWAGQYSGVPLGTAYSYSARAKTKNDLPFYVDMYYDYYTPYVLQFSGGGIGSESWYGSLYFTDSGGTSHYCYSFSSAWDYDPYGNPRVSIYYIDDWYSQYGGYGTDNRTLYMTLSTLSQGGQGFIVFGDGGKIATSSDVTSQVGSYIQNNAISKRILRERTGKDGELGTGWGYMLYDWTSDMRSWLIKVPRIDIAQSSTGTRNALNTVTDIPQEVLDGCGASTTYPSNPMIDIGISLGTPVTRVLETWNKQGSDCVQRADVTFAVYSLPVAGTTAVRGDPALLLTVKNLTYGVNEYAVETDVADWLKDQVYAADISWPPTSGSTYSNAYHCVCSGFRAVQSGIQYDVEAHVKHFRYGGLLYEGDFTYHPIVGVSFTRQRTAFMEVTTPAEKVATIGMAHLYYDKKLNCTFQIKVDDGSFYAIKVADGDKTLSD